MSNNTFKRVCVFCGSSNDVDEHWFEGARAVGRGLAEAGIQVVYGGGSVGLMGAVADAALEAGGKVMGIIPEKIRALEVGHEGLTELFVVDSMHARKSMMGHLSDAFIALPGGYGTLEELFEVITWGQLGYHRKPVGLLNLDGYYDGLIAFLDHAVSQGFLRPQHRKLLACETDFESLMTSISTMEIPHQTRWMLRT